MSATKNFYFYVLLNICVIFRTDIMYTKLNNIEGEEMNVNSRLNELEDKIKDVNEKQVYIMNSK